MPLFQVQDSDRPSFVVAKDWNHAHEKWAAAVARENDCDPEEVDPCQGILMICDDGDLIITEGFADTP